MEMFNPPHPGEILKDFLDGLGISARAFAQNLQVAPSTITRILNGQSAITAELAVKFEKAIGGPKAETWLGMQSGYDAWHAKHDTDVSYIRTYQSKSAEHRA